MTNIKDIDSELDIDYCRALDIADEAFQAIEVLRDKLDNDAESYYLMDFQRVSLIARYREDYHNRMLPIYALKYMNHLYIELFEEKCPRHQSIHSHFLVYPIWKEKWEILCYWGKFDDFVNNKENINDYYSHYWG